MDFLQLLEEAGKIAPVATALIATSAFGVGYAQLRTTKRLHLENNARAIWREYELLAMKNPEFHKLTIDDFDLNAGLLRNDGRLFTSYGWFISFTCLACEAVLSAFPGHADWQNSVKMQFDSHSFFLFSEWFENSGWTISFEASFSDFFNRERDVYRREMARNVAHG